MSNKALKVKKKKRRQSIDELRAVKEQQRILYLRQRRNIRKKQLVLNRVRGILRIGSIVLIFLAALYTILLPQWNLSPFIFTHYPNKSLIIKDNTLTSDSKILNKLKGFKVYNTPIFLLKTDELENELLNLDPIEKVTIRKNWLPARMKIIVTEKQPLFQVYKSLNGLPEYAITTDSSRIGKEYLPLTQKTTQNTYKIILPGHESTWTQEVVDKYETIIHIIEQSTDENVEYIDLSKPKDIYIKTPSLLVRLGELDATVIERLSRLKPVYPSIKELKDKIEYIDLRWDNALSLKEKTEPAKKIQEKLEQKKQTTNSNSTEDSL